VSWAVMFSLEALNGPGGPPSGSASSLCGAPGWVGRERAREAFGLQFYLCLACKSVDQFGVGIRGAEDGIFEVVEWHAVDHGAQGCGREAR
jgi:hypothetical protein